MHVVTHGIGTKRTRSLSETTAAPNLWRSIYAQDLQLETLCDLQHKGASPGHLRNSLAYTQSHAGEESHASLIRRDKYQLPRQAELQAAARLQPRPQTGCHQQHHLPVQHPTTAQEDHISAGTKRIVLRRNVKQ